MIRNEHSALRGWSRCVSIWLVSGLAVFALALLFLSLWLQEPSWQRTPQAYVELAALGAGAVVLLLNSLLFLRQITRQVPQDPWQRLLASRSPYEMAFDRNPGPEPVNAIRLRIHIPAAKIDAENDSYLIHPPTPPMPSSRMM